MTGLNHDFHLLNVSEFTYEDYWQCFDRKGGIEIYDDLLAYFSDTLRWIPTHNPAKSEPYQGLCWYGPTVIKAEGAAIARNIFQAWVDLFTCGPDVLNLGGYVIVEDNGKIRRDRLEIPRDELVSKLRILVDWSRLVAESEDRYFLLHLGI